MGNKDMETLVEENLFPSKHVEDAAKTAEIKLLESNAREIAQVLCKKEGRKGKNELSVTQARRFYNEFHRLDRQLRCYSQKTNKKEAFEKILPHIKLLRARVAFATGRKNNPITKNFYVFLDKRIEQITSIEDFQTFLLHFEAVLGFFYFYKNKEA